MGCFLVFALSPCLPHTGGPGLRLISPATTQFSEGGPDDVFFTRKARWPAGSLDLAVAGDSRTFMGVSPSVLRECIPGARVGNFGFSSAGFESSYLEAVGRLLDPASTRQIVLLGITPYSLTTKAATENQFLHELRRSKSDIYERLYLRPLLSMISPVQLNLSSDSKIRFWRRYESDGWVAARQDPLLPDSALRIYEGNFRDNAVAPNIQSNLMAQVRVWSGKGVRVFGFRPPTTAAMVELENRLSGFDEKSFAEMFSGSGGIWLAPGMNGLVSFDGSHLEETSAKMFSRRIGDLIASHLSGKGVQTSVVARQ